jgi:8-oxo-dGTP diphosphatase
MDKATFLQPGAWAVIYCGQTGKFLLGKRSLKVNKGGAWNLFGGRVDRGERPKAALVRELGEEAGLALKPRDLSKLDTVTLRQRSGRVVRDMHYYIMHANREFAPRLNKEHSEFRWFKPKQLPSRFNGPTWVAVKKGLLEKVARH